MFVVFIALAAVILVAAIGIIFCTLSVRKDLTEVSRRLT